jgi:branched-chain amino acid transport system substrate-binding protein
MFKRKLIVSCLSAAAVVSLAACSSSSSSSSGGASVSKGQSVSGGTIKIGLMTDLTGVSASGFTTTKQGVNAYIDYINGQGGVNGKKISIVLGDTTSSPTGALTAAQKLVQNDKVFAIIENSSVFYGAERYLLKAGIPVVGSAIDGPIWNDPKNTNLFAATGVGNPNYMGLAQGQYVKTRGVTSCAALGYSDSESAQKSATAFTKSCEAAGLKTGYLNTQVPSGTTDVGAIALAIKKSGANGLTMSLRPNTAFAVVGALKQLGVPMKSILLPAGYGSDLIASAAAVQAAQGVDFETLGYPAETHNAATDLRRANLTKVGATSPPTFGEQYGYLPAVGMVTGLKAAGSDLTQGNFTTKLRAVTDFTGDGLLPYKVNFSDYTPGTQCIAVAKLTGNVFVPVPGSPLCAGTKKF